MKPISGVNRHRIRRIAVSAALALALTLPLTAFAASAAGSSGVGRVGAAATASAPSCPWLSQSLPVSQRVQMLLAQMSLANKINMVTGAGFSEPYVFYISAIPSLCIPAHRASCDTRVNTQGNIFSTRKSTNDGIIIVFCNEGRSAMSCLTTLAISAFGP